MRRNMTLKIFNRERSFYALLCRCSFFSVTCTEERRIGIVKHFFCDIAFALLLNIAYSFFEARSESQPFSSVGSVT